MFLLKTYPMNNSTILRIYSEKNTIDVSPEYQRQGEIWTLEKRQLLIDSILNDFDIPKLYFHVLAPRKASDTSNSLGWAIIDGKQRLETIWAFISDEFPLAADFEFFRDAKVEAGNLRYSDIAKKYPRLKLIFDSCVLPIVCVETNDIDVIEDMFSRLNEAVPLNAAEKRNALGGSMAEMINRIARHFFFKQKVRFSNKRYQYKDLAAKMLYFEHIDLASPGKIQDTKKTFLDDFVLEYKKNKQLDARKVGKLVVPVLNKLGSLFRARDPLLATQTIIPIYYLLVRKAMSKGKTKNISRLGIEKFVNKVRHNREIAAKNLSKANYDLLAFERMSQQGTNESVSIKERLRIMSEHFKV